MWQIPTLIGGLNFSLPESIHKLKIFLLSIIGIIAVVIAILIYILSSFDDRDYQQLLTKAVDNFSDYTLSIKGSFVLSRSLIPSLTASEIELYSKANDSFITIGKFSIQLTLAALMDNSLLINDLLMDNMRGEISASDPVKSTADRNSYLPVPIIEHAVLKNI